MNIIRGNKTNSIDSSGNGDVVDIAMCGNSCGENRNGGKSLEFHLEDRCGV